MPSLAELKASSPEYAALSDEDFASRVYEKHYADKMSRKEFSIRTQSPDVPHYVASGPWGRSANKFTDPIGVADELQGAGAFVGKLLASGSLSKAGDAYSDAADWVRAERKVARQEGGWGGTAAEVLSGAAMTAPGQAVAQAAGFVPRVLQSAKAGAGFGAAAGAAQSEGGVGERVAGGIEGGIIGGIAGPVLSEVAIPAAARTISGIRSALRYGNQAVRSARNPAQAAVDNIADRSAAAGVDLDAMMATALADERGRPLLSAALRARGIDEDGLADIISSSARGEPAGQIGQRHGISAQTVNNYAARYRDANPTPMNFIDLAKEQVGEGGAAPITRLGRAALSLAGDEAAIPTQRLKGRQDVQGGRASNIIERSVAGGDFEATRAAGLRQLRDEANAAYRQFYAEPDLAINQLADLMEDPLFRLANVQAQQQARVAAIRRNQDAVRAGRQPEPVPTADAETEVFSPETLDYIQRQLRITAQGKASNPTAANHARDLREVFLDRIEDQYPSFRGIRRDYATGMGEFGEEGALEAGTALTGKLGAPQREALRGFDAYTPAQQELFRLGFARKLMDDVGNRQIGGAVVNQFNTGAVREIVERLYPRSNATLYRDGQRLLRDFRRETLTTGTRNDVIHGSQTAEKSNDMSQMMEGARAAADVATGRWGKLLDNLSTRLSSQIGRRGAGEVSDLLTQTEPAQVLPLLRRLAAAARTTRQRNAYAAAILEAGRIGARGIPAPGAIVAGGLAAQKPDDSQPTR